MQPQVLQRQGDLQLTYELPFQTFATTCYPLTSPNGSKILICAHESGVRIVWYGGRPFKSTSSLPSETNLNGGAKDDPMVIDLDEDEEDSGAQTIAPKPEFEEERAEVDPRRPFQNVLRYIDLAHDAPVIRVAVPTFSQATFRSSPDSYPSVFEDNLIFAAGLSDCSICVHVLPLAPPGPQSTNPAEWDLRTTKLNITNGHQDLISNISMTFTSDTFETVEDQDTKSRSRSRGRPVADGHDGSQKSWSLLVASTSCTANGLLLIHQIPITGSGQVSSKPEDLSPIQRQFLGTNLSRCILSFNPSSWPAERHASLLVGLPHDGCVRIYQVMSPTVSGGRRGSAATGDSSVSSTKSSRFMNSYGGKFLLTLYVGFASGGEHTRYPRRKRVLDAKWVLGGRAVLVLLETGEWGVWDIEAAGPSSADASQNLLKGKGNVAGIQGASITRFAVKGIFATTKEASTNANPNVSTSTRSATLVPMTTHSRRKRSDGLFQSVDGLTHALSTEDVRDDGAICVMEKTTPDHASGTKLPDEMLIFFYRDSLIFVPSLLAYWRSEASGHGSLESSASIRPSVLPPVRLGGQHRHSIGFLAIEATSSRSKADITQSVPDIVVATERRLILAVTPLGTDESTDALASINVSAQATGSVPTTDQYLLDQGKLGVQGMDRILNGMNNGSRSEQQALVPAATNRGVRFDDEDDDNDVDMTLNTPTPKLRLRSSRLQSGFRTQGSRSLGSSRRIFT